MCRSEADLRGIALPGSGSSNHETVHPLSYTLRGHVAHASSRGRSGRLAPGGPGRRRTPTDGGPGWCVKYGERNEEHRNTTRGS